MQLSQHVLPSSIACGKHIDTAGLDLNRLECCRALSARTDGYSHSHGRISIPRLWRENSHIKADCWCLGLDSKSSISFCIIPPLIRPIVVSVSVRGVALEFVRICHSGRKVSNETKITNKKLYGKSENTTNSKIRQQIEKYEQQQKQMHSSKINNTLAKQTKI